MFEQWMKFWRDWMLWWLPGGDRGKESSQPSQKSGPKERAQSKSAAPRKAAPRETAQTTKSAGTAGDDLTAIKGIGPSTAKKLAGMGVASFADLAAADPNDLARRLDSRPVTPERVRGWIAEAKKRAG